MNPAPQHPAAAKAVKVEPTLVLPVEPARNGQTSAPDLRFGPHSDTLFIAQMTDRSGLAAWVHWHTPTLASMVLVAGLLVLLWRIRRAVHRPRRGGQTYCPGCNYQLTFPLVIPGPAGRLVAADADTRCPECGVELAKHAPIAGRSLLARLLIPGLIALVMIGVGARVLVGSLEPYRAGAGSPWPSAWLAKQSPRLAWNRLGSSRPAWLRLSAYDLPRGSRKATVSEFPAFTADVSWIRHDAAVVPMFSRGAQGVSGLHLIDLETLEVHGIPPATSSAIVQLGQVQSGPDDRTAYFLETSLPAGSDVAEAVIRSIDLTTLSKDLLASVSVPMHIVPPQKQLPQLAFCIHKSGPDDAVTWALLVAPSPLLSAGTASLPVGPSRLIVGKGAERQEFPLSATLAPWAQPTFSPDGKSIELAIEGTSQPTTSLLCIDVATGQETQLPQPPARGRILPSGLVLHTTAAGFELRTEAGVSQYHLTASGLSLQQSVDVSPDGRWLAAWGMKFIPTAPNMATASVTDSHVVVWDLSALPTSGPSSP